MAMPVSCSRSFILKSDLCRCVPWKGPGDSSCGLLSTWIQNEFSCHAALLPFGYRMSFQLVAAAWLSPDCSGECCRQCMDMSSLSFARSFVFQINKDMYVSVCYCCGCFAWLSKQNLTYSGDYSVHIDCTTCTTPEYNILLFY